VGCAVAGTKYALPAAVAPRYWLAASAVGVGGFGLSFLIYNKVISAVDVGWAAIVLNLIPASGLLSSVIFLRQDPTRTGTIGACLIGGSVIYFTISDSRGSQADLSPADGPGNRSTAHMRPRPSTCSLLPASRYADRLALAAQ